MLSINFLIAILPFVLILILLIFKKISLLNISLIALGVELIIQIFYWKLVPLFILNSAIKGFFVGFDIFLIVFGAVFFLEILRKIKVIDNISFYLESISKDYRVQTVLLAWFLINFLEGMAGFGTPGAIVAPILVSIGLPPLTAVIISLLGNSSAGVFGAVGTPIRVGFSGLDTTGVPWMAVLFNIVGILMPIFMIYLLAKNQKEKWHHFFEGLPFAIWSGILFVVSSIAVVGFGQEFVSVAGSILAIVLIVLSIKLGLFIPKTERKLNKQTNKMTIPLYKVVLPYIAVIAVLVLGKLILKTIDINFPWGYKHSFNIFNPGIIFVITGIPFALWWGRKQLLFDSAKIALKRTVEPFLVILSMSTMTQLMLNSGTNISGFPSVLSVLTKNIHGSALPFFVPFIGAFGTFITGSITISNILFANILVQAGSFYYYSISKILALEISGAAIGNTVAVADIMAAEAVVGMKNKTRKVIRGAIGPCLLCLSILGIVGLIVIR